MSNVESFKNKSANLAARIASSKNSIEKNILIKQYVAA